MATANFNTQIVSSDSNGSIRSYSLDNVINKDFEGPYDYNFNTAVPDGISIQISDKFGYILVISPNIEFELSIVVTQSGVADPDFAIATTMITIEETPAANFNTEILSSNSNEVLSYNLDEVIDKNFSPVTGGYFYGLLDLVPVGFSIKGNTLFVPPFTNFNGLSVVVSDNGGIDPVEAIATTNVTVENNTVYIAEFNTEIISSSSNEQAVSDSDNREYVLDEVINKNFEGPYKYEFLRSAGEVIGIPENGFVGVEFPKGLEIIENMKGQQVLSVGSNIEFELSIIVSTLESETSAIATTMITIEGKPNFSKEITKFLENGNLQQNLSSTKNEWTNIINRSTNDGLDGPVRPR
jgi:hypothetical protein